MSNTKYMCNVDECTKEAITTGMIHYDESMDTCEGCKDKFTYIDGITWPVGTEGPRIPTLDDPEDDDE